MYFIAAPPLLSCLSLQYRASTAPQIFLNLDCFVAYVPRNDTFSARHCEPKAKQSQTLKFLSIKLSLSPLRSKVKTKI